MTYRVGGHADADADVVLADEAVDTLAEFSVKLTKPIVGMELAGDRGDVLEQAAFAIPRHLRLAFSSSRPAL